MDERGRGREKNIYLPMIFRSFLLVAECARARAQTPNAPGNNVERR